MAFKPKYEPLVYDLNDEGRLHPEEHDPRDHRTPFEHDRDRIIHSASFRRLQSKTQVYGAGASDYYRSRLTHSLEVAQIGRAIAKRLGADEDLVEGICLAHDIGHPPFGHAGEAALHELLEEHEGFNGNAQNLRILTALERKSVQYKDGGLNLTRATLDGLIKYPYPLLSPQNDGKPQSKGYYLSCKGLVDSVKLRDDRTFECQIMNWSDDVAYSSHDLEDGLVIGTIRKEDLENKRDQIATWAVQSFIKEHPDLEDTALFEIDEAKRFINDVIKHCIDEQSRGDRLAVIKEFVRRHIGKCVMSVEADDVKDAPSVRYSRRVLKDAETAKRVETYKAIVMVGVIRTTPVLTLQQAGKRAIEDIFNRLMDWQDRETPYLFPLDMRDDAVVLGRLSESDVEQHRELRPETISKAQTFVRDYVASLTDRHAEDLWRRMFLPGSGSALFVARL